jgi:hypothetical protein
MEEPRSLQRPEPFADRAAAYPKAPGELLLVQPLPSLQVAADHHALDLPLHDGGEGVGSAQGDLANSF